MLVAARVFESLQPATQITEKRVVTHRINRVHIISPHLLVTLREVALLIVLPGDVANVLYAQECIFVRFIRHVKNLTVIFATRSMVLLVVWLIPAAGALFLWLRYRLVMRLDYYEPLDMLSH